MPKKPRKPEAINSKSTPLNSHLVLNSWIYLRSTYGFGCISQFLRLFRRRRWSVGPFSFPFRFIGWLIKYGSVCRAFFLRLLIGQSHYQENVLFQPPSCCPRAGLDSPLLSAWFPDIIIQVYNRAKPCL